MQLPKFSLDDYVSLIHKLQEVGYQFANVGQIPLSVGSEDIVATGSKIVYLRHDIDLHLTQVDKMAEAETLCTVTATYYVPLTQHFNPLYSDNQRILKKIRDLGHEIGLHYDMETYPVDREEARRHLDWEVGVLSKLVGWPVRTICMHQPHKGELDPFLEIDEYIHPLHPHYQKDLLYVSDSCRAWRDENLLRCFGSSPPPRLMLTIHPELWLDSSVVDRMDYLNDVLMVNGVRQHREYFQENVRQVWLTHPAPKLHDERERRDASTP